MSTPHQPSLIYVFFSSTCSLQAEWNRPIYSEEANAHPSLTGGKIHMPKGACESGVCFVNSCVISLSNGESERVWLEGPAFLLVEGAVHMPKGVCECAGLLRAAASR